MESNQNTTVADAVHVVLEGSTSTETPAQVEHVNPELVQASKDQAEDAKTGPVIINFTGGQVDAALKNGDQAKVEAIIAEAATAETTITQGFWAILLEHRHVGLFTAILDQAENNYRQSEANQIEAEVWN